MREEKENLVLDSSTCEEGKIPGIRDAVGRRSFMGIGIATLLGLLLEGKPGEDRCWGEKPPQEIKHCILLWMDGGPSQIDTFDPKPGSRNGGTFGSIKTSVPGLRISEHLPRLAERMNRLNLIRSMSSTEGSHQRARYLGHTGFRPNPTVTHPSLGSIVSKELGDADSNLPQFVAVSAPSFGPGYLGTEYSSFFVNNPLEKVENVQLPPSVSKERFTKKLQLLDRMERRFALNRPMEKIADHHSIYRDAVRFMFAPEQKAFELDAEPESLRKRYGSTPFGQGCLLARRLIESGVRFVEVTLRGWDTHRENFTRTKALCEQLDPAFAALIDDLVERDLWGSTLVIWMGEFGRTPKINSQEGRDHFTKGWSVVLGGCGLGQGKVVGSTSSDGTQITSDPVTIPDLFYTVLTTLEIDPESEFRTSLKRPITYVEKTGKKISQIIA